MLTIDLINSNYKYLYYNASRRGKACLASGTIISAMKSNTIKAKPSHKFTLIPWLIMLLVSPFFFWGGPSYHSPRSYMAFWNLGHVFFFILLTFSIANKANDEITWGWVFKICLLAIIAGTMIELIQTDIDGRTASGSDVIRDLTGAILASIWLKWRSSPKIIKTGLLILTGIILLWNLLPLTNALLDEWHAQRDFPLLGGFENKLELSRWPDNDRISISHDRVRQGKSAMRVSLTTAVYSGVHLKYFPHDWHNYTNLHLSIFNKSTTVLPITIRVHDNIHTMGRQLYTDRFNRSYRLKHGWNDIDISLTDIKNAPKGRQMNMKNIRGMGIFVMRQKKNKIIYLDDIKLTKSYTNTGLRPTNGSY